MGDTKRKAKKDDGWGGGSWKNYMAIKQAKLDQQFAQPSTSVDSNGALKTQNVDIFKGVSIHVNGYTVPSSDELRQLVVSNGGKYHMYYNNRHTTHIIATNLPNSKIASLRDEKVVKPGWIVESVAAGIRLPEDPYRLYISNRTASQRCLNFDPVRAPDLNTKVNDEPVAGPSEESNHSDVDRSTFLKPADEKFLDQFYKLENNSNGSFNGKHRLMQMVEKDKQNKMIGEISQETEMKRSKTVIIHIDMDCFFVSVGLRNFPHLRGKPVVVTHAKNSNKNPQGTKNDKPSMSEISCCSYEARHFGIRNGMFLGRALELCPDIVTINYDFESYKDVSRTLYKTVASYTLDMEAVSCDELYIDCSSLLNETSSTPEQFASCLRNDVHRETGCTCSVGIGGNFLLARLATKKAKPNGIFNALNVDCSEFIKDHNVHDLPGVGDNMTHKLNELSVKTCSDLQKLSLVALQNHFGAKNGQTLYNLSRGIDSREIKKQIKRNSVSSEINYGIRFQQISEVRQFLDNLSHEIESRLKAIDSMGKTITLKLKMRRPDAPVETAKFMGHGLCTSMSRSTTLATAVNDAETISRECNNLFKAAQIVVTDVRGVGIQVTRLVSDVTVQKSSVSMETLDRFVNKPSSSVDQIPKLQWPTESPNKRSPNRSPNSSPSTARRSPKSTTGSPRGKIPYRYRAIEDHFRENVINTIATKDIEVKNVTESAEVEDSPFTITMSANEIKQYLANWVASHKVPLKDDVDLVGKFFKTLVENRQLEKVGFLLKMFNRLVTNSNSHHWTIANAMIQEATQLAVKDYCGGQLQL
ncbi:hypothetical protein CHUAL_001350 [Chamberlinius hualienensis]